VHDGAAHDDRLTRNTLGLLASSAITSVVGVAFWFVAARRFTTDEVGRGAALITAIVLLANVSTLGMRNALVRFVPAAGTSVTTFIVRVYAICASVAVLAALAFAAGAPWWADELSFVREGPLTVAAFAVFTSSWTLFVLQDSVLTGLRAAHWIAVENSAYSLAKLIAIVVLAGFPTWAFGVAWVVPALATVLPVSLLVRRRVRSDATFTHPPQPVFRRRVLAGFAIGDQMSDVLRTVGAELVVLVVIARRGAESSAAFYLAAAITSTLVAFASNIAGAFTAEAAARPHDEVALLRRSAAHAARLLVPAALGTAVLAPWIMSVFGDSYRADGGTLLRVLALGAIPQALVALGVGVARLHSRMVLVNVIFGAVAVGPILGATLIAESTGLERIGYFTLAGQSIVAAALLATLLRPLLAVSPEHGIGAWMVKARGYARHQRRARQLAALLDEIDTGRAEGDRLIPRHVLRSDNDVAVVLVEREDSPVVIKVALSAAAANGLRRHADALEALRASGAHQLDIVPRVVERGESQDHAHVIETARPGRTPIVADHRTGHATLDALRAVHDLTVRYEPVDDDLLATLVDGPIDILLADARLSVHRHALLDLRERLRASLGDRRVHTARTHGDCWTGNFLVAWDANSAPVVTGIIDWEDSEARGLADLDGVHHWLAAQPDGLAAAVQRAMDEPTVGSLLLAHGPVPYDPHLPALPVVLLAWLAHVSNGLRRASRYPLGSAWVARNVVGVLRVATAVPSL
jgi:O-antigen/teichoic acid export membrane protein/aminoglycoside phosphotransferase